MDLTKDVTFRGFVLNDEDIGNNLVPNSQDPLIEPGISGCVIDAVDMSDVDVVQFMEKRSQGDGMDVGDVFLGARRIRMTGTLYATTRAAMFDSLRELRAALSPVLSQRDEPADHGYQPIYFSEPTEDEDFAGRIDLRILAMPRSFGTPTDRDATGGDDTDALAMQWNATFVCRDPTIQGALPLEYLFDGQTEVTAATIDTGDLITKASHGLSIGDRVRFTSLTGGTGLNTTTAYYVLSTGFTSGAFKVGTTAADGSVVDVTVAYSDADFVKTAVQSGTLNNRGTYLAPFNAIWEVGAASATIVGQVGDGLFTITIPASTGARTVRMKGEDKVITVEEDSVELTRMELISWTSDTTWPLIDPGESEYSFTYHGGVFTSESNFWFYERYI